MDLEFYSSNRNSGFFSIHLFNEESHSIAMGQLFLSDKGPKILIWATSHYSLENIQRKNVGRIKNKGWPFFNKLTDPSKTNLVLNESGPSKSCWSKVQHGFLENTERYQPLKRIVWLFSWKRRLDLIKLDDKSIMECIYFHQSDRVFLIC